MEALALLVRDAPARVSVSSVVRRVSEYLASARGDALRDFFRLPLRSTGRELYLELLSALFALDDAIYAEGWVAHASGSSARAREAAAALKAFLSPTGPLLTAVAWMDADGGLTYTFPEEQLPERTRRLLASGPAGVAMLRESLPYKACLQPPSSATGRAPPLRLTPGLFFLFWTACAAVRPGGKSLRLAATDSDVCTAQAAPGGHQGAVERLSCAVDAGASLFKSVMASPQAIGSGGGSTGTSAAATASSALRPQLHPYNELLLALLSHCAPLGAAPAAAAASAGAAGGWGVASSPQPSGSSLQPPRPALRVQADMVVAILKDFWLSDPEELPGVAPSAGGGGAGQQPAGGPLPGALLTPAGTQGVTSPPGAQRAWAFAPPGEDRLAAVRVLYSYFASAPPLPLPQTPLPPAPSSTALAAMAGIPQPLAGLLRPTYRLLRASLLGWPHESHADLKPLLRLWAAVLLPWEAGAAAAAVGAPAPPPREDPRWRAYVLGSAPFSLKLLEYFAGLACHRLQLDAQDCAALLDRVLCCYGAMGQAQIEALRELEAAHNALVVGLPAPQQPSAWAAAAAPCLAATLTDWEAAAKGAAAAVSPGARAQQAALLAPSSPRTPASSFGASPRHAAHTLQAAAAAPPPMLCVFDERAGVAQCVGWLLERLADREAALGPFLRPDLRQRLASNAFAVLRVRVAQPVAQQGARGGGREGAAAGAQAMRAERLARPGLARRNLAEQDVPRPRDFDTMLRPIEGDELPLLVRLLVPLSRRVNAWAGLGGEQAPQWLEDAVAPLPVAQGVKAALGRARLNLRPLAEKQTLAALALAWLLVATLRALAAALASL